MAEMKGITGKLQFIAGDLMHVISAVSRIMAHTIEKLLMKITRYSSLFSL